MMVKSTADVARARWAVDFLFSVKKGGIMDEFIGENNRQYQRGK